MDDSRRNAISLIERELERLRSSSPAELRALAEHSPVERDRDGIMVSTHITPEGERLLVLVEAWRGRRTLATGGFAMEADGTAHTPH